jgi:surfactin synthase thioesterase subunit
MQERSRDCLDQNAESHVTLLLPHAGGTASAYREWVRFPRSGVVQLVPVELPGRDGRYDEDYALDGPRLTSELADELWIAGIRDVSLFGHSMGAILAYSLASALLDRGVDVRVVGLSAHGPAIDVGLSARLRSDSDAIDYLCTLGGTPPEILREPTLRKMLAERFRADVQLLESFAGRLPAHVEADGVGFAGSHDEGASVAELRKWQTSFRSFEGVTEYPGGHFYLMEHYAKIIGRLVATIESHMSELQ